MEHLSIDIETYSSIDIKKSGLYKYAESTDFEVLLFAYSVDFGDVDIVDLASGEEIPQDIVAALNNPTIIKHAYNAPFECFCLNQAGYTTSIDQWQCTLFHGLYCGYTSGLGITGEALGIPQNKVKDKQGTTLIRYFCIPCKPSKSNGGRTRNLPQHAVEKWKYTKD